MTPEAFAFEDPIEIGRYRRADGAQPLFLF
jgi:hypothetical protein